MTRFTERVERDLEQIADRATPSSTAWEAIQQRIDDQDITEPTSEVIMLAPERNEPSTTSHRWMMVAAAVAALALVGGLILAATRTDEDPVPADQPEPTLPAAEPETEAPTTALGGDDSGTAPFDAAALTAIGEQLVTALDTDDPDTIVQLVSDSADPISVFGATSRADLVSLFGWIDASDWRFEPQACEASEPDRVECTVLQSNAWATAAGAEPVEGTLFLRVENGQVVALRYGGDISFTEYFEDFHRFVRDRDPDDAAAMWATAGDGRSVFPTLTDKSFELFEQYTADYVESRTDSTTPVEEV
jgi:hypothetical protein